jgi:exodeoxyribonuclease VII large subunit
MHWKPDIANLPPRDANRPATVANADKSLTHQAPTVSQLTRLLRGHLEAEFFDVWVRGEISNFKKPSSGHGYFILKDSSAQLRACMFRSSISRVPFQIEDGMEVIVHGKITIYEARGDYQIIVDSMEPIGDGALQLAFEQLKKKLSEEGLFDPAIKKSLPTFPRRIGVVTSGTGAALRDILKVLHRRMPSIEVLIFAVAVQGEKAGPEIVQALRNAQKWNEQNPQRPLDLLIVGRGGGSIEDLWAFNLEPVVRALFACPIPTISAVGHEVDFTLCDFVADVRAPTPSAAAEIAVPNQADLTQTLQMRRRQLYQLFSKSLEQKKLHVMHLSRRLVDPRANLRVLRNRWDATHRYLLRAMKQSLCRKREQLQAYADRLDALSPLKVLTRGYSMTRGSDGRLLRSVQDVKVGDTIATHLTDGAVHSRVLSSEGVPGIN